MPSLKATFYTWFWSLTTIIPSHPSRESLLLFDIFCTGNGISNVIA